MLESLFSVIWCDPSLFIFSLHCLAFLKFCPCCNSLRKRQTQQIGVSYQLLKISAVVVLIAHEVAPILRKTPHQPDSPGCMKSSCALDSDRSISISSWALSKPKSSLNSSFTPNTLVTDPHPNTQRDQVVHNLRTLFLLQTAKGSNWFLMLKAQD